MSSITGGTAALIALLLFSAQTHAKPWWLHGVDSNETDFLDPDVAFRVGARVEGDAIKVRWVIADGYYLYRSKMSALAESPDLQLGTITLPRGELKTDPYLGSQEVFHQQVDGTVPYRRIDFGAHPLQIKVTYQGCAEAGLCYPPITKVLFPGAAVSDAPANLGQPWEIVAIVGGILAFLLAGVLLRKGRRLPSPATT